MSSILRLRTNDTEEIVRTITAPDGTAATLIRTPMDSPQMIQIKIVCDEIKDTLARKNKNYGNSALTEPYLIPGISVTDAIFVRLSDKFSRLRSLNAGEKDKVGESLADTVKDIAGYCILLLAHYRLQEAESEDKRDS